MRNKPGCDLLPAGQYDAVIMSAADKVSAVKPDGSGGNEMIELQLQVFDAQGTEFGVQDFLTATPRMQWKIRHLCESAHVEYEQEDLPASAFEGKNVRINVTVETHPKFGPQNRVADYLPRSNGVALKDAPIQNRLDPVDADIPF